MKKNIIILSLAALSLTGCGVMKNYDREEVAQPIDIETLYGDALSCLLYTSPSPRDRSVSRMPSSA